jgi:dephospho-CoA kinase
VVGVIGGVASGKSEVTRTLESLGAFVIHADPIGHEVLREPEVIAELLTRFPASIVDASTGQIDRTRVADLVFGDSTVAVDNRRFLEGVVHPRIRSRIREHLRRLQEQGSHPVIVLDVPLLLESAWDSMCDRILFVDAAREDRLARARKRGWSVEDFERREQSQWPLDQKRTEASDILDNRGSLEELQDQVSRWWQRHVDTAG